MEINGHFTLLNVVCIGLYCIDKESFQRGFLFLSFLSFFEGRLDCCCFLLASSLSWV